MKAYLAADPGAKGAMVLLTEDNKILYKDWSNPVDINLTIKEWNKDYTIIETAVEDVEMGGSGFRGVTKLAYNKGLWVGLFTALNKPLQLIKPRKWQKKLFRKSEGNTTKEKSINVAMRLFPESAKIFKGARGGLKDGRSDAALLAYYISKGGVI